MHADNTERQRQTDTLPARQFDRQAGRSESAAWDRRPNRRRQQPAPAGPGESRNRRPGRASQCRRAEPARELAGATGITKEGGGGGAERSALVAYATYAAEWDFG